MYIGGKEQSSSMATNLHLKRKDLAAVVKADVIFHFDCRAAIVHSEVLVAVHAQTHLQHRH